jgi:anti-sigma regulatory factor (Ser/Thr protein kinase)
MAAADVCVVRSRMDCLAEAIAFVEAFCLDRAVVGADCLRLSLVLEELFTNTVTHGHGGDSDAPVRLGLRVDPTHLELCYDDCAPPFDPVDYAARAPTDSEADVADRRIGELGIVLVTGMADRVTYAREDGWNRVRLALRRQDT